MSESESVRLAQAASLEISAPVAETMRQAGALDDRFSADHVSRTARQVVAAWAMAVAGDDTALAAIAEPQAAYWLMHPDQARWQVAPDPRVTQIKIWGLEPDREPPRFRVWHLESGHVETLDQYLHYVFTSRRETAEEYHRRTGSPAAPAAAAGPLRRYRVVAGFAEHDERFGSRAEVEVQRAAAPTRYEAEDLVWPAIDEETSRALGEGDWQPSLLWVDVIGLLDEPPGG